MDWPVLASITERLLRLHGAGALAVVFLLPALEASAFVGFVFPGELAVLLGGVLAYEHRVALPAVLAAAILGAAIGDSVGYEVGKRWGRRLLEGTIGRVVRREHRQRAERYLAERGGKAVFVGRFTAALRVLVPGLAGMSGMPYRTFVSWNVAGAVVWGTAFVLAGFVAGDGWRRVERVAKEASVLAAAGVAVAAVVVLAARWVARNPERVRAGASRAGRALGLDRVAARYSRQVAFLARRVDPRARSGLGLTVGVLAIGLFGWLFGIVTRDVAARGGATRVDGPVLDAVVRHRAPWLTTVNHVVTVAGGVPFLAAVVAVVGGVRWVRRGDRRPAVALILALAGSVALAHGVQAAVHRPRPPASLRLEAASADGFPSERVTQAAAVWGMLAVLWARQSRRWSRRVAGTTAALLAVLAVGGSVVYLALGWPTDVAGGAALGLCWLAVVVSAALGRRRP